MYDIAIIGAGINGCATSYELSKAGKNVVVFDMNSIAGGGSGAAGAFISPKFSKAGELKDLLNDAFIYSMDFYEKNFPQAFNKTQLLHIAKDENSAKTLQAFKENTSLHLHTLDENQRNTLNYDIQENEYIFLDSGIVDAQKMCELMCEGADFKNEKVLTLEYTDDLWIINKTIKAKKVVLASGAYKKLIEEPCIKLRGVWGHRIDIKTSTQNDFSIHQNVSISPANNTILAIGATHNVHYHPQTSSESYNYEDGRKELLQKASQILELKDVTIIKDYAGLRSGSFDYIPMIGSLVDSQKTLQNKHIRFKVKKPDYEKYDYYRNLYMINGSGGYGFVLAPYLVKMLSENILENKKIDKKLQPARFFARWAKK